MTLDGYTKQAQALADLRIHYTQKEFKLDEHFHFSGEALSNLDAQATIFFQRELEFIMPELFMFTHARINARKIFPIDRSAAPTSKTITSRQFRKFGQAQIVADYADDVPLVNVSGEEQTTRVRGIVIGAQWSIQEIRAAAAHNRPLERMYAEAAREAMLREENGVAFNGSAAFNMTGLFSTGTGIPQNAAPTGTWSAPATAANILADMNFAANTITQTTNQEEAPNTLLLPVTQYNQIASTKHGTDTDTTILRHFIQNNPYINEVIPVRELAGAVSSNDVMIAYDRNPSKIRMQIPLDIEQLAPEQHNMAVRVFWHMRFGGLTVHKPSSLHIVTGI